jgi:hypothetical protein
MPLSAAAVSSSPKSPSFVRQAYERKVRRGNSKKNSNSKAATTPSSSAVTPKTSNHRFLSNRSKNSLAAATTSDNDTSSSSLLLQASTHRVNNTDSGVEVELPTERHSSPASSNSSNSPTENRQPSEPSVSGTDEPKKKTTTSSSTTNSSVVEDTHTQQGEEDKVEVAMMSSSTPPLTASPNKTSPPTTTQQSTSSSSPPLSFQQQYLEQQERLARFNRGDSDYSSPNKSSPPKKHKEVPFPHAPQLVGAATVMSTQFTLAMNKVHEMLQRQQQHQPYCNHTAHNPSHSGSFRGGGSSESFTSASSSMASTGGDEKKIGEPHDLTRYFSDSYTSLKNAATKSTASFTLSQSTSSTLSRGGSSTCSEADEARAAYTAAAAELVEEISPMMRMRHEQAQQKVLLIQADHKNTTLQRKGTKSTKEESYRSSGKLEEEEESPSQLRQASNKHKTEEQVKAEKQKKWKRKMKLAQQQRALEQSELHNSMEDDDEVPTLGCRPGSDLADLWNSLAGETNKHSTTTAKNPAALLQKVLQARCGIEVCSSSDEEEDDDDDDEEEEEEPRNGYSYSDEEDEDYHGRGRRQQRRRKTRHLSYSSTEDESDEEEPGKRRSRGRAANKDTRRGRSRRPRSTSPTTASRSTTSHSSKHETEHYENEKQQNHDGSRSQQLQEPNFRLLGKQKQEQQQQQQQQPTTGPSNKKPDPDAFPPSRSSSASSTASSSSVGGDGGGRGGGTGSSKMTLKTLSTIKSVSFDESTISKTSSQMAESVADLDTSDPHFIKNFVQSLATMGIPLLWHRVPTTATDKVGDALPSSSNASMASSGTSSSSHVARPEPVIAFLKLQSTQRSTSTDGFVCQPTTSAATTTCWDSPRLVWYQQQPPDQQQQQEWVELANVDLFDIATMETASTMSPAFLQVLEAFPFSMPSRTFVLQLSPDTVSSSITTNQNQKQQQYNWLFPSSSSSTMFVLEAPSDEAARTFVHGMKWMVARLSYHLIVGSVGVSCELLLDTTTLLEEEDEDDDDGMAPTRTRRKNKFPPRRTKVMNDITSHMVDKTVEKSQIYLNQTHTEQQQPQPSASWKSQDPPAFVLSTAKQ